MLLPLTPKLIIKFQMNVCLNLMQKNKKKTKSGFDLGRQCAPGGITNGRRKTTFKKLSVYILGYTTEKERKDTILLIIHSLRYIPLR